MENKPRGKLWFGFGFLILIALIALVPTIASTNWGFKQLSKFVPGTMSAKHAHLSWFSGQKIQGFRYKGPHSSFTFDEFSTDSSLLTLILTQRAADTKLLTPKLALDTKAFAKQQKKSKAFFLPFKGGAVVEDGYLALKQGSQTYAEFKSIDVHLNIDEKALPITLKATGKTMAGSLAGGFNIQGRIASEKDASDLSRWLTKKLGLPSNTPLAYQLNARLQNFPLVGQTALALGPTLSAQAELDIGAQTNDILLSAHSKTLSVDLRSSAPEDSIEIHPGSTMSFQLTPKFWHTIQPKYPLLQPIKTDMRIANASLPIEKWQNASGSAVITTTDALIESMTISRARIQLDTLNLAQLLGINLTSNLDSNGKLDASFTWPKPLDGMPSIYALLKTLKLNAINLPLAPLGLSKLLGPQLNLSSVADNDRLDISASSSKLNTSGLEFKINPTSLQLAKPGIIRYTAEHPLLLAPTPVNFHLTKLTLPKRIQDIQFQGKMTATQIALDQFQLGDTSVALTAKNLSAIKYSLLSRLSFMGQNNLFKELLGPALNLSGNGIIDLDEEKTATLQLTGAGKTSELNIDAKIEKDLLILTKPIAVKTILTKKAFNLLKPETLARLHLTKKAPIHLELAPFSLTLPDLRWKQALNLNVAATQLSLKAVTPFVLSDFETDLSLSDSQTNIASSGNLNEGSYDLHLAINKADQTIEKAVIDCQNISSNLIDGIFGEQQTLERNLGPAFDLNLKLDPNRYKIDLSSPRLSIGGAFKIDANDRIASSGPVLVSYLLGTQTLEGFVTKPSKINFKIDTFQAPLKTKPTLKTPIPQIDWDFRHILIDARAHSDHILFTQNKINAALYNFEAKIDRSNLDEPLDFELASSLSMQKNAKAKQRTGQLQLSGYLSDFYDSKGQFSTQNLSLETSGQIKHLPTLFLDIFYPDASALFGDTLNASLSTQIHNMNGTVYCDVTSPHTRFKLDSYISNGILHLRAPLNASLTLTPALSNLFLSDAKLVALSAQKPIQLYLDSKNVAIPIRNFNWQNVRIGKGRLDFGKIIVASQGTAADLIDIFKIRRPNQVTLWFAPLDFSIKNGKMDIQRTEILYDAAYQIAIWGRINFPRRYVDMTLGLTAQSLYRSLGLRLPPNYVLTIDVEGPFGNVQIDKGDAIAKIALLIADQSGLAPQEGIPGAVFDIIQGFAQDQSKVPPPRPPFPWSH